MMRVVSYGGACSFDGYIAGPNGELDWLYFSKDLERSITEYWQGIDTVVMGRKSWMPEHGAATGEPPVYPGVQMYVFSRTLPPGKQKGAEIVNEDAAEFVRRLKSASGKGICVMGGGELAAALFDAGLIDEVGMNIHPVLLGGGVPAFRPLKRRIQLQLIEQRPLEGGCVFVNYRVQS